MTFRPFVLPGLLVLIVAAVAYTGNGKPPTTTAGRLAALETAVSSLQARIERIERQVFVTSEPRPRKRPDTTGLGRWKDLAKWSKIKDGMSEAQVIRILGKPTRRSLYGTILHWEGFIDQAGTEVSGNVHFSNNKVWMVEAPVW